jgi:hypothetical protein
MLLTLGACNRRPGTAAREYALRYPGRRHLDANVFRRHQHPADELVHTILWTDEACFTREGVFSIHSSHLWARDNPHAICERGYQARFSVRVWAGIVGDIVVGPCLLSERLTAQRYREFLETVLPGLLEDVPLAVRQRLWFQHDGARAHYGEDVRQWLNATYPGRWIGRGGPIAWPPRSSDLTPMDFFFFFLWGHLQE